MNKQVPVSVQLVNGLRFLDIYMYIFKRHEPGVMETTVQTAKHRK